MEPVSGTAQFVVVVRGGEPSVFLVQGGRSEPVNLAHILWRDDRGFLAKVRGILRRARFRPFSPLPAS